MNHKKIQSTRKQGSARWVGLVLALVPMLAAPGRCGESAEGFFSEDPAPDMRGTWDVTYDDIIQVEIDIGGVVHQATIPTSGGTIQFTHDGQPVTLEVDCSKPWVVCPSEVWPSSVMFDQPRFATKPHQVAMQFTQQQCTAPRLPDENQGECSSDPADNLPCDQEICDPENVVEETITRIASISQPDPINPAPGSTPDYTIGIALNGGMAVPAANCLLLAASFADADVLYDGVYDPEEPTMIGHQLADGVVTVQFTGACFWGNQTDQALLGASVKLTTGFTATKAD